MPAPPLIIPVEPTPAFFLFMTLAALCEGQYISSLYIPRRYPRSNKRAIIGPCPPSSASTAENSPATDHAAPTASKNAPRASTPDPKPTPHREALALHTSGERGHCSHNPASCACAAASPAGQTTR